MKRSYKIGLLVNKNKRNLVKLNEFKMEMGEFFDVCSCACPSASCLQVHCKAKNCDGFHLACKCDVKISKREIQFLLDQRYTRKMIIADMDRNVSRMWGRAAARDEAMEVAAKIEKVQVEVRQEQMQLDLSDESAYKVGDNDKSKIDEGYIQMNISDNSSKRNLTKLSTLASVCDRYGVSNYANAAIASATLVDYAIITKVDKSQVIGTQKLGDERRRCREERREAELENLKKLTFLYCDGKKIMTRVLVKNNKTGRWSPTVKVDNHYVVLTELGNDYLTHVTPKTGHGKIYDFLVEHELTKSATICCWL